MKKNEPSITAFIPARGGSKGIIDKNIKEFCGKPLVVHSIQHALNCKLIDNVIVSSDDPKILQISNDAGATIIERPPELANDTATTESSINHFLKCSKENPDIIVLLQATSPLRPKEALDEALKYFMKNQFDSLLSICPTHRFFWKIKNDYKLTAEYDYLHRPRRQDIKSIDKRYIENGSLYIFTKNIFDKQGDRLGGKIGYVEWPEEFNIEIDTPLDFLLAEKIYSKLNLE